MSRQTAADTPLAALKAIEEAHTLMAEGMISAAVLVLEQAVAHFPKEPELIELLKSANEAEEAIRRARAVARTGPERLDVEAIRSAAQAYSKRKDFKSALELLDHVLRDHPEAEELRRLRNATRSAQIFHETEREVQEVIRQVESLMRRRKLEEAQRLVDSALSRLSGHRHSRLQELVTLSMKLRNESEQRTKMEQREKDMATLNRLAAFARTGGEPLELRSYAEQARELSSWHKNDPEFHQAMEAAVLALETAAAEVEKRAAETVRRKRLIRAAAATAAAMLAIFLYVVLR